MAPFPAEMPDLYRDPVNTARETRARYQYQDECVAVRCIANLISREITAVVVEWCSDYLAVAADGTVELVSIKHREPGQPAWTPSVLRPVLVDLYRYWRAMEERCTCVFASSIGVSADVTRLPSSTLAGWLDATPAEATRFWKALTLPTDDTVLSRRKDIGAVAIRDLGAVLEHLDRDPAYAEPCYVALAQRIARASIDRPPEPAQRIARLSGSMRSVLDRTGPDLAAQTLRMEDLCALVVKTHDACAAARPAPIVVRRPAKPRATGVEWRGGTRIRLSSGGFLIHAPVAVDVAPDGGFECRRARARRLEPVSRDVWLIQVRMLREGQSGYGRLAALKRESELLTSMSNVEGAPRVVALDIAGSRESSLVVGLPDARSVSDALGPPGSPYPCFVLDALLRGLPMLLGVLAAMHERHVAHRALAPDALLLTAQGQVVPRDLGLAACEPVPGEGPPGYRAPEQDRPLLIPPGPHTDVYQLAAIVYHLATGHLPGPVPAPPSLLRPDLSPRLDQALAKALDLDHRRRCSLGELRRELSGVLRGGGTAVTTR